MFDIIFDDVIPILGALLVFSLMADLRAAYELPLREFERQALQIIASCLLVVGVCFFLWDIHHGLNRPLLDLLAFVGMLCSIPLGYYAERIPRQAPLTLVGKNTNEA